MKKLLTLTLLLLGIVALSACASQKIDKTKPAFETEDIMRVTLYMASAGDKGFEVPQEHLAEISQESSPTPQFKSINFLALSLLHSPTLTSTHDHRKNHSLD